MALTPDQLAEKLSLLKRRDPGLQLFGAATHHYSLKACLPRAELEAFEGSIGISMYPVDGCNTDTLLRCADEDMYRVKLSHRQRRMILTRSVSGLFPYVVATGLAAVSPYVTLAIMAALALFYALPIASGVGVSET